MELLKKVELLSMCKERNLKNYKTKPKKDLIELLQNHNQLLINNSITINNDEVIITNKTQYINKKTDQYSSISIEITNMLSTTIKKQQGIFITPRTIITDIMTEITTYISNENIQIKSVLEPSCGSCEIILSIDKYFKEVSIDGVELNTIIFEKIKCFDKTTENLNKINIINSIFITYKKETNYDLIVSNPPYVTCDKATVPIEYIHLCKGRVNLFCIFIIHSLHLLNANGVSAFIIPKSFMNSCYYSQVRGYIKSCCTIVKILEFNNDFIDTKQPTIGLILHKKNVDINHICKYSIKLNDMYVFTTNKEQLEELFKGSTTIKALGLNVKTGNIVWNEKKSLVTADSSKTLLLFNSNIRNKSISILNFKKNDNKKQEKFQYIDIEGSTNPIIVVNRGNGNSTYKFNYAIVNIETQFVCENHLNVIYSNNTRNNPELLTLYDKIITSFENPKTNLFIKMFLGNNALSKTELETIFPIYL